MRARRDTHEDTAQGRVPPQPRAAAHASRPAPTLGATATGHPSPHGTAAPNAEGRQARAEHDTRQRAAEGACPAVAVSRCPRLMPGRPVVPWPPGTNTAPLVPAPGNECALGATHTLWHPRGCAATAAVGCLRLALAPGSIPGASAAEYQARAATFSPAQEAGHAQGHGTHGRAVEGAGLAAAVGRCPRLAARNGRWRDRFRGPSSGGGVGRGSRRTPGRARSVARRRASPWGQGRDAAADGCLGRPSLLTVR